MAYLLQKLDGLESANGRCIVATTNNPEKLDAALLRPGRFDLKLCLSNCSVNMYRDILKKYYKYDPYAVSKIEQYAFVPYLHSPLELINIALVHSDIDSVLSQLNLKNKTD